MSAIFAAMPVVWIVIEDPTGEMIRRFCKWKLDPVTPQMTARKFVSNGPFHWSAAYEVDDAERIIAWLKANGAVTVKP